MDEVRRDGDDELCGFVAESDGRWTALTVFRGLLGDHADEASARRHVLDEGLAAVAERWTLVDRHGGGEQVVCIQQLSPDSITLALDYYSLPGVPTMTFDTDELVGGRWSLERRA